ncbi:BPSS1780 family membrane protein [Pseudorhodoferax sp.]|uniref:BPSS1780 family membrane protein n=1 Tax=Pseudorhodoferax sp. TaxID=1993553 RepID=UPI002DD6A416|nr:BPSS1780 family membrane protein [Pseudorhodoferax sp.]
MAMILNAVGPGRGAHWVRDGLRLYLKRPLAFTALFIIFLFMALFVALLPLVGGLLQMMLVPLLSLGFMVASRSALQGGAVRPIQFFEPLRAAPAQRRALLLLCVAYGLLVAGVLLLADLVADGGFSRALTLMRNPNTPQAEIEALLAERSLVSGTLVGMVALTLVTIPFWHAPALVHWGHQGPGQALFSSTLAVWRSRGAFLVYGLTWFALMLAFGIISAVLFGLLGLGPAGPLLAMPAGLFFSTLFYVSLIFTYDDSFGAGAPPPQVTAEPSA